MSLIVLNCYLIGKINWSWCNVFLVIINYPIYSHTIQWQYTYMYSIVWECVIGDGLENPNSAPCLDDEALVSDFVEDGALHDAPSHRHQDERGAHVVWAVRLSPEKLDLMRLRGSFRCIMTGWYLHNVGSHHLKAPDDLILCRRNELEGQQNENHTDKTHETLACAKQPGGHHPVTEQRRRPAITSVWVGVQKHCKKSWNSLTFLHCTSQAFLLGRLGVQPLHPRPLEGRSVGC